MPDNLIYFQRNTPPGNLYFLHFFLISYLLLGSLYYALFGMWTSQLVNAAIFLSIGYYLLACLVEGKFFPVAVFTLLSAFFLFQIVHFSIVTRLGLNLFAFAAFYGPLSFVIAWFYIDTPRQEKFLRIIYTYSMAYTLAHCFLFFVVGVPLLSKILPADASFLLIKTDDLRGARMWCAAFPILYAFFWNVVSLQRNKRPINLGAVLVGTAAIASWQGRVATILIVLILAIYFGAKSRRALAWVCAAIFCTSTVFTLWGLFDPNFNPFAIFGADMSASVRGRSFNIGRLMLLDNPILGVGYDSKLQNIVDLVGDKNFNPIDLGSVGIYYSFGLFGVALFVACGLIACFNRSGVRERESAGMEALFLISCFIGAADLNAPLVWFGDGSVFFGIVLAQFLKGEQLRWTKRSRRDQSGEQVDLPAAT